MLTNTETIEFNLLLRAINQRYGHDFNNYASNSLQRRVKYHCDKLGYQYLSQMLPDILHNEQEFENLLNTISVPVTDMFRDPNFFLTLREKIIPVLRTYPSINIWHAGCASGEEVYSLAIIFKEEGLYDNCKIYATDFNDAVLEQAKSGVFSMQKMQRYTEFYYKAGGKSSFSDYYVAHKKGVKMIPSLSNNIVFAKHNLAVDQVFGQFNLILCRNVLIYFNNTLQNKVFSLFYDSLMPLGFMCLGSHESITHSLVRSRFNTIAEQERIYRKCD
ncbi:MAG: protein-glutamate O-methyltransferase CheR [Gammaproteobacteria bacterium]|nr:protein-glutamate O-methyltransferase CheR [Gammaproteobacteria bacterium]